MLSCIYKTEIYKIIVDPCNSITWEGLFNFKPNSEDVAAAIHEDVSELDQDVEHEADMIQDLQRTLELVTLTGPRFPGGISIAGMFLGEISIAIIKVFSKEKPSMMPLQRVPAYSPCDEIPGPESTSPAEEEF